VKVAVSCDALMARDHVTSVVEMVLALYEDAEIYTIVHQAGRILGPVEQRKIHSTYLTNVIDDPVAFGKSWWKKAHLIPGACRNLYVPCSVDLLINISSGFSQGISCCKGVYQITYLVENIFNKYKAQGFFQKIFRSYVDSWAEKSMATANELWVTCEKDFEFWNQRHPQVRVMSPFFKASDFPLFPEATRKAFPNDFFAVDAESFDQSSASELIEVLKSKNLKFKFVGNDFHLTPLKRNQEDSIFFGSRCSGELAPFLAASRGFISGQKFGFPTRALEALSVGTPVWIPESSEAHHFINGPGVYKGLSLEELSQTFSEMEGTEPRKLHGQTTKFHDLKFKAELKRRVDSLKL